jgi:hypothetical protein
MTQEAEKELLKFKRGIEKCCRRKRGKTLELMSSPLAQPARSHSMARIRTGKNRTPRGHLIFSGFLALPTNVKWSQRNLGGFEVSNI